ncbi:chloride transporter, partial [Carbonactinospora thermoautotrophica]
MTEQPAVAYFAGRLAVGLRDVTSDVSALDSRGFWAVVVAFEGEAVCARFDRVLAAGPLRAPSWRGPRPNTWSSSLDRDSYLTAVELIRKAIAEGEVYQANL